jgi:PIN domain nuclease of toxin-antitoxin system
MKIKFEKKKLNLKNQEAQFSINQMSNDEIKKKKIQL